MGSAFVPSGRLTRELAPLEIEELERTRQFHKARGKCFICTAVLFGERESERARAERTSE